MGLFSCEVLTPYRRFFAGKVESLVFVTHDGQVEILADHEPVVAPIRVGILALRGPDLDRIAAVTDGFVRVKTGRVDILVGTAEWPEEIDRERAERAYGRAMKRIAAETQEWSIEYSRQAAERAQNRIDVFVRANRRTA